jgi:hypothetical protein
MRSPPGQAHKHVAQINSQRQSLKQGRIKQKKTATTKKPSRNFAVANRYYNYTHKTGSINKKRVFNHQGISLRLYMKILCPLANAPTTFYIH